MPLPCQLRKLVRRLSRLYALGTRDLRGSAPGRRWPRPALSLECLEGRVVPATQVISVPNPGLSAAPTSNGNTDEGFLSADNRFVVFVGSATDLVPGDTNNTPDVFVRDRQTGVTTRVNTTPTGGQANGGSNDAAISADGRYVAFTSGATNLVPGDTNGVTDLFVKDLQTGAVIRASSAADGTQANTASFLGNGSLSADGRYVVFVTNANNLVPGDTNNANDVFRKDLQTGAIVRASVTADGSQVGFGGGTTSIDPATISADGRYVAFLSNANNLVPGDTNNFQDLFVKDLETGAIVRANTAADGTPANGAPIGSFSLTPDARYVAFASAATNLVPGDMNGVTDLFVKDLETGAIVRANTAADGTQSGAQVLTSTAEYLSADGRYVAFNASGATDLVPGVAGGPFVKDLLTGAIIRVSFNGTSVGELESLSADGRFLITRSSAPLIPGDVNNAPDVFITDLAALAPGTIQFGGATFTAGESGGSATVTLTRTPGPGGLLPATVQLATADGTATAGADYSAVATTVTFAAGQASATVTVPVLEDTLVEGPETVNLALSSPTGGFVLGSPATAVLTIADNDGAQPGLIQFGAATYSVGEGGGSATITLTRTEGSAGAVSVTVTTSNGTATAGADYTAVSQVVTFAAGQTTATVAVPVTDDALFEGPETVNLALSNPTGGALLGSPTAAVLTIADNDVAQPGVLQFSAATYSVGEGGSAAAITITRTGGTDGAVGVTVNTSNGTATAGADYTAVSRVVNFAAGQSSATVTVPVTDDALVEGNETVNLALSAPTGGATLGSQTTAVLTIADNDVAQPGTIQFSAATYAAGEGGGTATITLTRTGGSDGAVGVTVATSNGTATAGADYTAVSTTISFAAGQTTASVTIPILEDALFEGPETVNLALSAPSGGAALGAQATAVLTIADNDPAPAFSISDVTVTEGNDGTTTAVFTVTLTGATALTATVQVATADGTAAAGSDYTAVPPTTLTFAPGQTSQTVTVTVAGDTAVEPDETFTVNLSNPTNATVADAQGVGTILNDDAAGAIQFSAATYSVGEGGGTATITLTRTGGSSGAVSVTVTTSDGTATAGADYTAVTQTVTFADGQTTASVTIPVLDDALVEGPETVNLALSGPTGGATLGAQTTAVLTIADNDVAQPGTIQFSAATYAAGEGGGNATITLTRTAGTDGLPPVTVQFATGDGTATAGADYSALTTGVTFAVGQTTATVSIFVADDALVEGPETVNLTLSNPTGGFVLGSPGTAVLTITDDDVAQPGVIQFSSALFTAGEGDGGATIFLTRTGGSSGAVSVQFTTGDDTATAGADYTAVTQTVTFADGQVSATVTVPILDDAAFEASERVNLTLSNPTGGATLGATSTAVLRIDDNDPAPAGAIRFSSATYSVGEGGGAATITLTRTGGSAGAVAVVFVTGTGTATAGEDYSIVGRTVTFAAGQTTATVTVPVLEDAAFEGPETVELILSNPSGGATLGSPSTAVLTIVDNDAPQPGVIQFSSATYSVGEGGGRATITLTRTGGSDGAVGVTVATSNGSATAGADYTAVSQVVAFAAGQTSATVTVPVLEDTLFEGPETVNLFLSAPTGGATLGFQTIAELTIADNEFPGVIQFAAPTYSVDEGGGSATIFLTRTGGTDGAVAVTFETGIATATPGADYTTVSQVVTFAAGQTTATATVPVTDDALFEGPETVNLFLSAPTGGATLGARATAVLTIVDNDAAQAGAIQFSAAMYVATENSGNGIVTLSRTGGSDGAVSVTLTTSDGTATAGADYTAVTRVVTFAAGQTNATVLVPILSDALVEGPETVNLTLSDPTGGATLGARTTAVLTILNSNPAPRVDEVRVNDGSEQRSRVTSVTVTFSTEVVLQPGAFVLERAGGGAPNLVVTASVVDGRTVAVLTFTGPGVVGGSVPDGRYTLTVRADRVTDRMGRPLAQDRVEQFFRLTGDADGDGRVDSTDVAAVAAAIGTTDPAQLAAYDADGDGDVDFLDLFRARQRLGTGV